MLNWAWRHKRKIVATAVVGGATAYGVYYLYRKKRELDELVESLGLNELLYGGSANSSGARSSATQEERVREHFDDTQREADRLLREALPRLQEQIAGLIMTDALQERLRAEGPSAEPAGWHELKVLVVSRLLTAQYALVLTVLAIRIRLNIIGRHYLNEAQAAADGTRLDGALSKLTKKRFLSLERWLAEGLQPLEQQITACVRAHLASEAASDMSKESFFTTLCTTQVSAAEALTVLAPIRAELELGLRPHETGQGSSAPNADVDDEDEAQPPQPGGRRAGHSSRPARAGAVLGARAGGWAASSASNGHSNPPGGGKDEAGGATAAAAAAAAALPAEDVGRDSVVRGFLIEELNRSHGSVAHGDQLQELLDEVRTLVGSNAFRITLEKLLEVTFATVGEQLQQAIGGGAAAAAGGNGCGAATGTVPKRAGTVLTRAKLLPKYKQLSTATLAAHEPYAAALLEVPSLQDFCWQVYLGE